MERLLIDECLSQALLAVAKERGVAADHVVWLGKSGMRDSNLVPFAVEHDYVIVTSNRRDFLRQYAKLSVHDGLIILVPMANRAEQIRMFGLVLDFMDTLLMPGAVRPVRSAEPRQSSKADASHCGPSRFG